MSGKRGRIRTAALVGGFLLALLAPLSATPAGPSPFAVRAASALTVGNLAISYGPLPQVVAGQPLTLTIVVKNTASARVVGAPSVTVPQGAVLVRLPIPAKTSYRELTGASLAGYACKPAIGLPTAVVECRATVKDSIPAGASRTFAVGLNTYPGGGSVAIGETLTLKATVDPNSAIAESTELDNTTTATLPVTAPALVVRWECWVSSPKLASPQYYNWKGTWQISVPSEAVATCTVVVTNRTDATAPAIFDPNSMLLSNTRTGWASLGVISAPAGVSCPDPASVCTNTSGGTLTLPIGGSLTFSWKGTMPKVDPKQGFMVMWLVNFYGLVQLDPSGLDPSDKGKGEWSQFGGWIEPG